MQRRSYPALVSPWLSCYVFRAKLHYTDTGYEHRLRTPPTDKLTTILQQICHIAMPEPNISTCQDVGMWQIFVRFWFVTGVRSRCPCSGVWLLTSSIGGGNSWAGPAADRPLFALASHQCILSSHFWALVQLRPCVSLCYGNVFTFYYVTSTKCPIFRQKNNKKSQRTSSVRSLFSCNEVNYY